MACSLAVFGSGEDRDPHAEDDDGITGDGHPGF